MAAAVAREMEHVHQRVLPPYLLHGVYQGFRATHEVTTWAFGPHQKVQTATLNNYYITIGCTFVFDLPFVTDCSRDVISGSVRSDVNTGPL